MAEINLMDKYPKTKRNVNERAAQRTAEDIAIAKLFEKDFFDGERKHGYGGYYYNPRFWTDVVKDFISHYGLTNESKVLDVGSGKGFMLLDLKKALPGLTIRGIDISNYAIENSMEEVKPYVSVGNAKDLSQFRDKEFDLVISINTVHNLKLEECKKALREIERVGKNSFIVVDGWRNDLEEEMMRGWNLTAETFMHTDDWKKLFAEIGFTGDYYWFIPEIEGKVEGAKEVNNEINNSEIRKEEEIIVTTENNRKTMKSAVLVETAKPLQMQELQLPELKDGQVLVKVISAGLCRAQLNEISAHKGPDKYLPHTLGHEASAFVEEVGKGVTKVKKGDYVVLTWIKGDGIHEQNCEYIRTSDNVKINSGPITAFNEYSVVSENRVVKIPEEVPPDIAALLGCVVPTGLGIIKNELEAKERETIAIFGSGGIGSTVLFGASSAKLSTIIAVDINDKKLEFAKENGATHTINSLKEDVVEKIKEITNGEWVDYAVDCIGIPKVSETAFDVIKNSGIAVIAGNAKEGERVSVIPFELIKGKRIIGTWGGATKPDIDIPYYAQEYLAGRLELERLISKKYSFENINQAIEDLKEGLVIRAMINIDNKLTGSVENHSQMKDESKESKEMTFADRISPLQEEGSRLFQGNKNELPAKLYELIAKTTSFEKDLKKFELEQTPMFPIEVMGSSPMQLNFLQSLIMLRGCKNILEIGTFVGSGTMYFANALPEDGKVTTIEKFDHFAEIARSNFRKNNFENKIRSICGDAAKEIKNLHGEKFDFVYIDGNKERYGDYFEMVDPLLESRGMIVVDDAFFNGDVLNNPPTTEKGKGVKSVLEKASVNDNYHKTMIPIGNGILLLIKK